MAKKQYAFEIESLNTTHTLLDATSARGGYFTIDSLSNIPEDWKATGGVIVEGSMCFVTDVNKFYKYSSSDTWEEVSMSGGGGSGVSASQFFDAYDSTKTYVIGDKVSYSNNFYLCKTRISTAEAFNSSKWVLTKPVIQTLELSSSTSSGSLTDAEYALALSNICVIKRGLDVYVKTYTSTAFTLYVSQAGGTQEIITINNNKSYNYNLVTVVSANPTIPSGTTPTDLQNINILGTYYSIPTSESGMSNPMTTAGDLILGGSSGTPTRLGIGTNGQVLTSDGTTASWQTPETPQGGMENPMTAVGDIIVGSTVVSGTATPTKLAVGANGTVLTSNGTTVSYQPVPVPEKLYYLTIAPSSNNPDSGTIKIVVLDSEPSTKYDGYLYIITGTSNSN